MHRYLKFNTQVKAEAEQKAILEQMFADSPKTSQEYVRTTKRWDTPFKPLGESFWVIAEPENIVTTGISIQSKASWFPQLKEI